jgi:ring-1,2-phenylacetyl-CoA epoxidase subunit PaaE
MTSLHFHPLRVRDIQPDTDEAFVVSFEVPPELAERFRFAHGQYLTLRALVDGQDLRRSYSICAGVDDPHLRVGVRRVPGGLFSQWVARSLKPGDTLEVMPPQGRFSVPLDREAERHYLGIAGGSGITPILSIMKTVLAREPRSDFTLIYGNRKLRSTMFKEELEDLKDKYLSRLVVHHVFSDEHTDADINRGVMNREKIGEFLRTLVPGTGIDHAFICGPFQMNDEAEAALLAAGMAPERIHVERFGIPVPADATALPAQVVEPGDAPDCALTVIRDGVTHALHFHEADGNLLDCAAKAGINVPYSCKTGVCGTCRAHLDAGEVRMARNYALEKRDLDAGFILTCQSHPTTPEVTISFDHR